MRLVTREQWAARPPKQRVTFSPTRPCTGHWNGPKLTVRGNTQWDHSFCAPQVRGIQNFHMDSRGWSDIAYNWLVCQHGYVYEGRGLKYQNGANGTNMGNKISSAICYLGGEGNPFTDEAKNAFHLTTKYVSDNSSAPTGAMGHRDHKSTRCPGDEIYNWIGLGMPIKYTNLESNEEENDVSFESHEERVKFVKDAYRNIAKREPAESEWSYWVYIIAANPVNALNLIVGLHAER